MAAKFPSGFADLNTSGIELDGLKRSRISTNRQVSYTLLHFLFKAWFE